MGTRQAVPEKMRHILLNVPPDTYKIFRANCLDDDTNMRAQLLQLIASYNEAKEGKKETVKDFKAFLEMSGEDKEKQYTRASKKAIDRQHALGLSTTHGDDKGIYKLFPDGHREYIEACKEKNV